jgi:predicted dehydrogenase
MEQFKCRWAALSLSNIAGVFLPDLLQQHPGSRSIEHKLVAISTTGSAERAASWFKEHKVLDIDNIAVYHSWEQMLENADFDVVYISTPHPLHYQHVRKALDCKRNVLVEKPATMNRAQYEKLADLARKRNVVLMEAMWTRYLPAARYFKDELLPKIGDVRRVYADFSFPIVSPDMPHSSRFLDKKAGAGSLLDQGVYALTWVDLALNGRNVRDTKVVHASSMSVPDVKGEVDDINTVVLNQSGKPQATAIVTTSMTLPGSSKPAFYQRLQAKKAGPVVRVEATRASVAIPFPPIRPQELHVQWYDDEHLDEQGVEKDEVIFKPVEEGWGMWYQADVIVERIAARASGNATRGEIIGVDESLRVLGWMDEARQQAGIAYDQRIEAV